TRFSRDWSSDVCSSDLAVKTLGQVGHASQHAVTLVRPRNGKPHAAHVIPREVVEGQILVDGLDPPSYGGLRTVLGPRRSLQQLRSEARRAGKAERYSET